MRSIKNGSAKLFGLYWNTLRVHGSAFLRVRLRRPQGEASVASLYRLQGEAPYRSSRACLIDISRHLILMDFEAIVSWPHPEGLRSNCLEASS